MRSKKELSVYNLAYRTRHKERIRKKRQAYNKQNKKLVSEKRHTYYLLHRERIQTQNKANYRKRLKKAIIAKKVLEETLLNILPVGLGNG